MNLGNTSNRARIFLAALVLILGAFWAGARFGPHGPSKVEAVPLRSSGLSQVAARDSGLTEDESINVRIYRQASPAVANILTKATEYDFFMDPVPVEGAGSGFIIDPRGYILTNYHVVEGAQSIEVVLGDQSRHAAKYIGADQRNDVALIKIDPKGKQLAALKLGDSNALQVGQKVLAIGNPFGLDRTLTTGVISGLERPIRAQNNRQIEGAIQTDASINPGNSGGPLLDSHGRMIGINSQILSPSGASAGVGFAIPVSIAKRIIPQLIRSGEVRRPKLGIIPRDVAPLANQVRMPVSDGVLILQVQPAGGAANAGLRGTVQTEDGDIEFGDIIVGIEGEKVKNNDDLFRILDKHQVGDTVNVEVVRNGRHLTVPVRLTEATDRRRSVRE